MEHGTTTTGEGDKDDDGIEIASGGDDLSVFKNQASVLTQQGQIDGNEDNAVKEEKKQEEIKQEVRSSGRKREGSPPISTMTAKREIREKLHALESCARCQKCEWKEGHTKGCKECLKQYYGELRLTRENLQFYSRLISCDQSGKRTRSATGESVEGKVPWTYKAGGN